MYSRDPVLEIVKKYINDWKMIPKNSAVIAAVSGGADSMAMLDLLQRLRGEMHFSLQVVHINHGIRGEEALRDASLVEEACGRYGIPCQVVTKKVPELASYWGIGLEEAGRRVRSEILDEVRREASQQSFSEDRGNFVIQSQIIKPGHQNLRPEQRNTFAGNQNEFPGQRASYSAVLIALAHNQNDQAETLLHHLARGTGLPGLSGIRPVSGSRIRPILCLNRSQIEDYLSRNGIEYVTDSTNLEDHYTRNRIRHHILPALEEQVNSQAVRHMADTALQAAEAVDYLMEQGRAVLAECQKIKRDRGIFLGRPFLEAPPVVQAYAVLCALEELGGRRDVSVEHIREVCSLTQRHVGTTIILPNHRKAVRYREGISISRDNALAQPICTLSASAPDQQSNQQPALNQSPLPLTIPGLTRVSSTLCTNNPSFQTRIFTYSSETIHEKKYTKWLDYDKIEGTLKIRTRRQGDTMTINEAGQHKKLTRVMMDDGIPSDKRDQTLLIACGSEILWIVGGRMAENVKIDSQTKRVLEIKYREETT